jgi:uncharacterized protein
MDFEPRRFRRLRRLRAGGIDVPMAAGFRSRLLGLALLGRERAGPGLLIPRCRSVHTLGMRFPIDIVFLDSAGREIRRLEAVPPFRTAFEPRAAAVLELPVDAQTSGKPIHDSPVVGSSAPVARGCRSSARVSRGSRASSQAIIASAEPTASTSAAPSASASGPASR